MLSIIEVFLFSYFVYVIGYTSFFSFIGLLYRTPVLNKSHEFLKFCVLMPCYKEDSIILETAPLAMVQSYPSEHFQVVVIADSLRAETIRQLLNLNLRVVPVQFDVSTKVKSLNKAFEALTGFDYCVILDADNVMAHDFLEKMNDMISNFQLKAIQGQRSPKNHENTLAFLDGLSEAINNHIYRQGSDVAGLSSSISGSGIVIDYNIIKAMMATMNAVGGFDRELELLLLQDGIRVRYFKEAEIFDEKVSQTKVFGNQRRRWISSQYFYLRKYFKKGILALLKGDWAFFNASILRNIQLPRLINIGLFTLLMMALFFVRKYLLVPYTTWATLFIIYTAAILLAIPGSFYSKKLLLAILRLPLIFIQMVTILFKLKGANKTFIHTPHGKRVSENQVKG